MKTTKKDFEVFKRECEYWVKKLQLDDMEIHYWHENPTNERADASTSIDTVGRRADIRFSVDNFDPNEFSLKYIKDVARHEMLHILLDGLNDVAHSRFILRDQITQATEVIIRKLEKIL